MKLTLSTLLAAACFSAHAFDLKGVSLGDPMTNCPENSKQIPEKAIPGGLTCEWNVSSFAGEPVRGGFITSLDGKVVSMYIRLNSDGRHANGRVVDAMIEKFGLPGRDSKPHINEYRWTQGGKMLALDGWKGTVIAMDMDSIRAAQGAAAKSLKNDL